jgi:hypothetical protein
LFACHTEGTNHKTNSFLYWGGASGFSTTRRLLIPSKGTHWLSVADIGNVRDRTDEFEYLSVPYDSGKNCGVERITWMAATPGKTKIRFQVRAGSDKESLARSPWKGPKGENSFFEQPGLPKSVQGNWIQYKAILRSPNGANSPILNSVTLEYGCSSKEKE